MQLITTNEEGFFKVIVRKENMNRRKGGEEEGEIESCGLQTQ